MAPRKQRKPSKAELPEPPRFHICGLVELRAVPPAGWSHVISIWNSSAAPRRQEIHSTIRGQFLGARVHIAIFDDIEREEQGYVAPTEEDISEILVFSLGIPYGARVLVHCMAGLRRSTAVAYAIACQVAGAGYEQEAFEVVRAARPQLAPNQLIVEIADLLLQRHGAMSEVVDAHWRRMAVELKA